MAYASRYTVGRKSLVYLHPTSITGLDTNLLEQEEGRFRDLFVAPPVTILYGLQHQTAKRHAEYIRRRVCDCAATLAGL